MSNILIPAQPIGASPALNFLPSRNEFTEGCKWQFDHIRQQYLLALIRDTKKDKR
jgi:hypothetical protein